MDPSREVQSLRSRDAPAKGAASDTIDLTRESAEKLSLPSSHMGNVWAKRKARSGDMHSSRKVTASEDTLQSDWAKEANLRKKRASPETKNADGKTNAVNFCTEVTAESAVVQAPW